MKRKLLYISAAAALAVFFLCVCLSAEPDSSSVYIARSASGPVFYSVMLVLSVAVLLCYISLEERRHIWTLLLFAAVCIVNVGYFALSVSGDISEALLANRIAYFGNVYMLLFLIISLGNALSITFSPALVGLLFSVSTVMFLFSSTQGYLDIFYRNTDFVIENGFARILKDYGPMHTVYIIYILCYMGIIVGILLRAAAKKENASMKYCVMIGGIGLLNVLVWLTEQFVSHSLEFLALSYVLNEVLIFRIYHRLVREGALDSYVVTMKIRTGEETEKTVNLILDNRSPSEMFSQSGIPELEQMKEEDLRELICRLPAESRLTERETEVAVLLLRNLKRKEMAAALFVSEDTIKTHTSHIYGKLKVKSRAALRELAGEIILQASGEHHPASHPSS